MGSIMNFRVWSNTQKKFLNYEDHYDLIIYYLKSNLQKRKRSNSKSINIIPENEDLVFQMESGTIDVNGTLIYEGDILERENKFDEKERAFVTMGKIGLVAYYSAWPPFENRRLLNMFDSFNFKVIGNILENPELVC